MCVLQVDALHALMLERVDDEDAGFLLATTATSARMLAQAPTRAALLAHPEVAARFAELLQHPAREVGGLRLGAGSVFEQLKACGWPHCGIRPDSRGGQCACLRRYLAAYGAPLTLTDTCCAGDACR